MKIRISLLFAFFTLLLLNCTEVSNSITDDSVELTEEEKAEFLYSIIRFTGKLAGKASHATKFDEQFDDYYRTLATKHQLIKYHHNLAEGKIYFLLSRVAPSIHEKYVAIAGSLKKDESGIITYYEESFRTWKMPKEEMLEKSGMLYEKYVKGESLNSYYPQNSGADEYIEFPDEHTYFDIEKRRWISTLENPLEEYYNSEGSDYQ